MAYLPEITKCEHGFERTSCEICREIAEDDARAARNSRIEARFERLLSSVITGFVTPDLQKVWIMAETAEEFLESKRDK